MVAEFATLRVVAVRDALPGLTSGWCCVGMSRRLKTYLCMHQVTPRGHTCAHERDALPIQHALKTASNC